MQQFHDTRIIGSEGEMMASAIIQIGEIFRVQLLGGNVEAFDLYAEINDKEHPFPFLIQVKTTDMDNRYNQYGIVTPVADYKLKWLVDRPIPTYVAGFDLRKLKMYLSPAFNTNISFQYGIPVTNELRLTNRGYSLRVLRRLKKDIWAYWTSLNASSFKHGFISQL